MSGMEATPARRRDLPDQRVATAADRDSASVGKRRRLDLGVIWVVTCEEAGRMNRLSLLDTD